MGKRLFLLLGGARSGKSTYAENWGRKYGQQVLFVATAQAFDDEMRERITRHQAQRPAHWQTLEAPYDAGPAITTRLADVPADTIVLDCLTLLVSNHMLILPEGSSQEAIERAVLAVVDGLLAAYRASNATWLIVTNEVGMGVVPPTPLGRFFRDALGRANQRVAEVADEVLLLVAGLPWQLK